MPTNRPALRVRVSEVARVGRYNTVAVGLTDGNLIDLFLGSCVVLMPVLELSNETEKNSVLFQDAEGIHWHFVCGNGEGKLSRMVRKENNVFTIAVSYFLDTAALDQMHDAVQFVAMGGE